MEAFLSGSTGFALDPSDLAVLFQDAAGQHRLTGGQSVGRVNGKWGPAASFISQSTGAAQPVWSGSAALTCDEVDDAQCAASRGHSGDVQQCLCGLPGCPVQGCQSCSRARSVHVGTPPLKRCPLFGLCQHGRVRWRVGPQAGR